MAAPGLAFGQPEDKLSLVSTVGMDGGLAARGPRQSRIREMSDAGAPRAIDRDAIAATEPLIRP